MLRKNFLATLSKNEKKKNKKKLKINIATRISKRKNLTKSLQI